MAPEIIVALCSLLGTLAGSIGGIFISSKLTTYRIEQLEKKVDKHNGLVERVVVLERDQRTLFRYHDDQQTRIQKWEGI